MLSCCCCCAAFLIDECLLPSSPPPIGREAEEIIYGWTEENEHVAKVGHGDGPNLILLRSTPRFS